MAFQACVLSNTLCLSTAFPRPKPNPPLRLHKTRGNAKGCFADSAKAEPLLQANSKKQEIGRPLANFAPDIWGDHFLTLPFDNSEFESCSKQVQVLKAKVKDMLVASESDPIANMHLIHTLCRLGVSHHFQNEIEKQLAHYFASLSEIIDDDKDHDLHTIAVIFQVFRSHGYNMSSDVFNKFKDGDDKFKASDTKGIISVHEATQFRTNGEVILDEALAFTKPELQSIASQPIDSHLIEYIVNTLDRPYLKDVHRLEARKFIYLYENDASRNETLLKFAKYDFNWIQMLHQQELKALCRHTSFKLTASQIKPHKTTQNEDTTTTTKCSESATKSAIKTSHSLTTMLRALRSCVNCPSPTKPLSHYVVSAPHEKWTLFIDALTYQSQPALYLNAKVIENLVVSSNL
ncbi:hypothetical protein V6N11_028079 [Hibiscus sabdariffa]|uniref:Terpene synthase N-terminal domain-containing protein n=2 Tax=Hibiscus sabdariffa TaxID=183260 RepID=A0ABR2AJS0_9ROSI